MSAPLYYEAHVTLDPVFDDDLAKLKQLATAHHFRVADLFMQKRREDTPERSKFDAFTTARATSYDDLRLRSTCFADACHAAGFKVRRLKIEAALLDIHYVDAHYSSGDNDGKPSVPNCT